MAELLFSSMEFAVSTEVLQAPEMGLAARTTPTIPTGSNDMEATGNADRALLAEADYPPRLAGKTYPYENPIYNRLTSLFNFVCIIFQA